MGSKLDLQKAPAYNAVKQPGGAYGTRSGLQPNKARRGLGNSPELGNSPWCPAKAPTYNSQPTEGEDRQFRRSTGGNGIVKGVGRQGSDKLDVGPEGQKGRAPRDNNTWQPFVQPKWNRQPTEK